MGSHTLFTGQIERERERETERQTERGKGKRERRRERERERKMARIIFFKRKFQPNVISK
jgi:hypothetical protein